MNNNYGQPPGPPPGFNPQFGYGPPPGMPGGMGPPPNPMNPQGPGGFPPQAPQTHGLAIASMICGILAIFPGCCCGLFGMPLSIAAVVMGIVSMSQINASNGQRAGKGMAIAGLACGGVAIALNILGLIFNVTNEVMKSTHI
jgi:hypothetical protein